MKITRLRLAGFLLAGATAASAVATTARHGMARAATTGAQSLRLDSEKHREGGFFPAYHRTHRGGGLRGGK